MAELRGSLQFQLNYKDLQIQYLSQKINDEFGKEPFFEETLVIMTRNK